MTTLVTGAGLIGTEFARCALARGEAVVFLDPEPRADFLRMKLGAGNFTLTRHDVRDLPALIAVAKAHRVDTLVHTAGLIGPRVQESLIYRDVDTLSFVPLLARSWQISADGLSFTFQLRKGVTFSDGYPLTADDVVFHRCRQTAP